jgi:hypothetical protein
VDPTGSNATISSATPALVPTPATILDVENATLLCVSRGACPPNMEDPPETPGTTPTPQQSPIVQEQEETAIDENDPDVEWNFQDDTKPINTQNQAESTSPASAPKVTSKPTLESTIKPSIGLVTPQPTRLRPTAAPQFTFSPTPNGTNSWAQTYGMTDPFLFVGPPLTTPPVPAGLEWLYTPEFTNPRPLQRVGNDGNPEGVFPLGPCQADCDSDIDCAGPLECFQRQRGDDVPGCIGQDDSSDDYCVWPNGYVNGSLPQEREDWITNGLLIKLYWEEGYNWQNETFERKCKF